jgi:hypothetical protein
LNDPSYGVATEQGYYDKHIEAFNTMMTMAGVTEPITIKVCQLPITTVILVTATSHTWLPYSLTHCFSLST